MFIINKWRSIVFSQSIFFLNSSIFNFQFSWKIQRICTIGSLDIFSIFDAQFFQFIQFIINKWRSIVFSQSIFLIFSILRSSIPNFLGKFNESVRLVAEKFTLIKTSRLSNTIKIRHPLNRIERKGWIKIYSPPSWNDGIKLNTDPDKPKVLHIYATFRKQYVYP